MEGWCRIREEALRRRGRIAGVGQISWRRRRRRIAAGVGRIPERHGVLDGAVNRSQSNHYVHAKDSYEYSNRWPQGVAVVVVVLVVVAAETASVIVVVVLLVPSFVASSVLVARYCARSPD